VRARLDEARVRAQRSGDADVEMRVWFSLAIVAYEAGEVPETLAHTRAGLARARERGVEWSFYGAELRHLEVVARYVGGDWDGSLAAAQVLARVPEMAAHVRAEALLVLVGRGDPAARQQLAWAQGLASRRGSHVLLMLATVSAEIDLAVQAGDARTAVERARWADCRLRELWGEDRPATLRLAASALSGVADAAAAARTAGDAAAVAAWTAEGEELAGLARAAADAHHSAIGPLGIEARAWTTRLEAELARVRGDAAPGLWRSAVDQFGYGNVYEQARSRFRLAGALLSGGDRAGAARELQAAHEVAVRLRAEPLRTAVEALARRGRLAFAGLPRSVEAGAVLTPRETEVLALLAQGRTNRQIGAELYISEKTASVHVSNILAKLAAGGRTEAVAIAAARGLLG
jgi:DNA-binding CsgD family transcriptional regulator